MPVSIQTEKARALVIGAGVNGLTTALLLRRNGFDVTVVAEKLAPDVTSVVAGALWEWPPAVCGSHQNALSLQRSKSWCSSSYTIFSELANDPETGVFLRLVNFYFKTPVEQNPKEARKMNELRGQVREFRHDAALVRENRINPNAGVQDAYQYLTPMVDTDTYMDWLLTKVKAAGCAIVLRKLTGALTEQELRLRNEFCADVIVNCAGLGARELAKDPMWPLRGALVRLRNENGVTPCITQAHCMSHDGVSPDPYFIFILPRGRNMLLAGGMAEPNEWNLDINLENYRPVQTMFDRCLEFLPALKNLPIDEEEPVRVGLRPVRRENMRLELEPGTRIIHNYGHGGSGVTFSWGCAEEVAQIARSLDSRSSSLATRQTEVREAHSLSPCP
jgi:D-amino-acid oxidase